MFTNTSVCPRRVRTPASLFAAFLPQLHELLGALLITALATWGFLFDTTAHAQPASAAEPVAATDPADKRAWSPSNDPAWFNYGLERTVSQLPREGRVSQRIWTSSYFPLYQDTTNVRWYQDGAPGTSPLEYSAAEKYDQAFNAWTPPADFAQLRPFTRATWDAWDQRYYEVLGPLANYVSRFRGNKSERDQIVDYIENQTPWTGWAMEEWWGLCHAWAPASLFEREPCGSVTRNGVTFFPGDLEALLILAYDEAWREGMWLGAACRDTPGSIARDQWNRPTADACFDTNIGTFHVVVTNLVGLKDRPLLYDRVRSEEIWNQPLIGYRITHQFEIDETTAASRLQASEYVFNPEAQGFLDVRMEVYWLTESQPSTTPTDPRGYERTDVLTYVLELDGSGQVVGGELYGSSLGDQAPDYLWQAEQLQDSHLATLDLQTVRELIDESCGDPPGTTPYPELCPEVLNGALSCGVEGQLCNNTWFAAFGGYDTAVCSGGIWQADHLLSSGPPPPPPPSAACPNGVFGNGFMYDENLVYGPNTCAAEGATCQGIYFYALGDYRTAVCRQGSWHPSTANSE